MAIELQGVDISNHQPNVNFDMMKAAGVDFVMAKVSQATTFLDPQWTRNRSEARRVGMAIGGYHFFRWDIDALDQAQFFVQMLGPVLQGDLPPCVDIENTNDGAGPVGFGAATMISHIRTFLDYVDTHTGRKCMIYSYPDMWRNRLGNTHEFADHPLWIASYKAGAPSLIGGWAKHSLWQTTSTGHVSGVPGIVDLDIFNGTSDEWASLISNEGPSKAIFFEETQHSVNTGFRDFFLAHGQVEIFGFPLTEEIDGTNGEWSGKIQVFERAVMEWHEENGLGRVMLRNIGTEWLVNNA